MVKAELETGPPLVRTPTAAHAGSLRGRRGLWHVARPALALVGAIACLDEGGLATAGSPVDVRPYPSYIALESGRSYSLPIGVGVRGSFLAVPVGIARVLPGDGDSIRTISALHRGFAEWDPGIQGQHPLWIAVLDQGRAAPILVGHHGVPSLAPENTLAGVRVACELGLPGIEVDVRFTADSVPVLMHDRDIRRTSNGTGYVDQLTVAQLDLLDVGSWFRPIFVGERIPTLVDFLKVSAQCGFDHIELDVKSFVPLSRDSGWVRIGRAVNEVGLLPRVLLASDLYSVRRAVVLIPGARTMTYGGVVTSDFADTLIASRITAIGVRFDQYQASAGPLARLDSAGVMVGAWAPPGVLDLNALTPTPRFVTTDWGWRFVH